jgi:hypothetical protein
MKSSSGTKTKASGRPVRAQQRSSRPDDGNAFVADTIGQLKPLSSPDAEAFAEEFIGCATGAESVSEDAQDEVVDDEDGGPFIVLNDEAQLPTLPDENKAESEGHESVEHEHAVRGANWAARGV